VPGDTPFRNLTSDPPPGVGAYRITESVPNRRFVLTRNPLFGDPEIPGVPVGRLASITTKIVKSPARQAQDVIRGDLDYMQDAPPADLKQEVRARFSDRYRETPSASTYYFFMNTRVAPFDDPKVREAVNYAIDKRALVRLFAGDLAAGCSFIPPSVPGYDRNLDREGCPWGDPAAPPDLERARRLIGEAGARGARVTVWGNSDNPTDKVTLAYTDMLNKIGLDAKPRIVDGGVYFQVVGNQRTRAQTGFNNWFQDFPHPKDFFFLVDGRSIQATNNPNPGNVADPDIDRGVAALERRPRLTGPVTDRWEALNRTLVERGWVAPYGHSNTPTFLSERMNFEECAVVNPVYGNDYSRLCLK
jgi:peptide/nickel transport system substrate-binding protein